MCVVLAPIQRADQQMGIILPAKGAIYCCAIIGPFGAQHKTTFGLQSVNKVP
jgi:hypothetical protein